MFTRPTVAAAEPDAPPAASSSAAADVGYDEGGASAPNVQRRPVRGDHVTICKQPRNTDFLQPGQVGTVVDVDDMDVEDVWFTVEDADGETDEYCEADLVIAGANVVASAETVDESGVAVTTLAPREPVSAGRTSGRRGRGAGRRAPASSTNPPAGRSAPSTPPSTTRGTPDFHRRNPSPCRGVDTHTHTIVSVYVYYCYYC